MKRDTIIFDLDGTLADTAPDLLLTLNRVVEPEGLEPLSQDNIGHLVGHGAKPMIERAFNLQSRNLSNEDSDRLFGLFLEIYSENIAEKTRHYPGVIDALDALEELGFSFCVCTNKREDAAKLLLQKLGTAGRFKSIVGGNSFAFRKPNPKHLSATVELAGSALERSIMIGDSSNDILAAQAAGIPSIAVTFGYSDVPVESLKADAVLSSFTELQATIFALQN